MTTVRYRAVLRGGGPADGMERWLTSTGDWPLPAVRLPSRFTDTEGTVVSTTAVYRLEGPPDGHGLYRYCYEPEGYAGSP